MSAGARAITLFSVALCSSVAFAGATASSFKAESRLGANYWNAQSAIDSDMKTCWQLPGDSDNVGEWVQLDIPKSTIDKISMVVGWDESETRFTDYPRVKAARVEAFQYNDEQKLVPVASADVQFEDKRGWQTVDIPDIAVGGDMFGGKVTITVTEIYPGQDYPNLAISELLVVLKDFDAATTIKDVSDEVDGKISMDMVDDSAKTYWAGTAKDASIKFEATGFTLSQLGIQDGPKDYGRPKKVKITANNREQIFDLKDMPGVQWVQIPAIVGYTGSAWGEMTLDILEVYPGAKYPDKVAIAELDLKATAYEGL